MHAPYRQLPYARLNSFHGPKQRILGNQAGNVAPAWRVAGPAGPSGFGSSANGRPVPQAAGSKILLSQLPPDVAEREVEELFKKTVGPLKDSFIIYNSQGKSKGMAVVAFQRPGDAAVARSKYDGKFVDGRRPIRIEIISDDVQPAASTSTPQQPLSLFSRIGLAPPSTPTGPRDRNGTTSPAPIAPKGPSNSAKHMLPRQAAALAKPTAPVSVPIPPRRLRQKKGPKRIKKQMMAKSAEQLDQEMEDYRAEADLTSLDS